MARLGAHGSREPWFRTAHRVNPPNMTYCGPVYDDDDDQGLIGQISQQATSLQQMSDIYSLVILEDDA